MSFCDPILFAERMRSFTQSPLSDKRLCIIDGFDMVGKTTFIKNFMKEFRYYHPNHDITDCIVGRDNSWTIGYGIIDFFSQVGTDSIRAVIDRGPASGYVYKNLYGNIEGLDNIYEVIDFYSYHEFFKNGITHIHVCHLNRETAKRIYELSQSREVNPNAISAELDKFDDFDDYWSHYLQAEELFSNAYKMLKIEPIRVAVDPDEGTHVLIDGRDEIWKVGTTE